MLGAKAQDMLRRVDSVTRFTGVAAFAAFATAVALGALLRFRAHMISEDQLSTAMLALLLGMGLDYYVVLRTTTE